MIRDPIHVGKILHDELEIIGITPKELAEQLDIPPSDICQIIKKEKYITGDTALRLAHWFGTNPLFWLNLQSKYEVKAAEQKSGSIIRSLPRYNPDLIDED